MNQAEIINRILADYWRKGGSMCNAAAATVYVNAHKPAGIGRINEVICRALMKEMITKRIQPKPVNPVITDTPPAAIIEPAPHVIASNTVTFPEVMPAKPVAVYHEAPETPEAPATPEPEPAPVQIKDPAVIAQTREVVPPPKKSLWNKLKFWKK